MTNWLWYRAYDHEGTASVLLVTYADAETLEDWRSQYEDGVWQIESYRRAEGQYWDGDLLTPAQVEGWKKKPEFGFYPPI
jgi:hypothetical protein